MVVEYIYESVFKVYSNGLLTRLSNQNPIFWKNIIYFKAINLFIIWLTSLCSWGMPLGWPRPLLPCFFWNSPLFLFFKKQKKRGNGGKGGIFLELDNSKNMLTSNDKFKFNKKSKWRRAPASLLRKQEGMPVLLKL